MNKNKIEKLNKMIKYVFGNDETVEYDLCMTNIKCAKHRDVLGDRDRKKVIYHPNSPEVSLFAANISGHNGDYFDKVHINFNITKPGKYKDVVEYLWDQVSADFHMKIDKEVRENSFDDLIEKRKLEILNN